MSGYIDKLIQTSIENNSIVCMGADPDLNRIPIKKDPEVAITRFYIDIIDVALQNKKTSPGLIKPNYAFYARYGFPGLRALKKVIEYSKSKGLPVDLDAKRGDIGKTSAAYAEEVFRFWGADAVTVAPYMGSDSVGPFIEWSEKKGKGVYILDRTSNKGGADFQNLYVIPPDKVVDGKTLTEPPKPLYIKVLDEVINWGAEANGNVGIVAGATSLKEFEDLSKHIVETGALVPILIPGVGAQGGSAFDVTKVLVQTKNRLAIQRINSSSGINYACEKKETDDYAGAAAGQIRNLNEEIEKAMRALGAHLE